MYPSPISAPCKFNYSNWNFLENICNPVCMYDIYIELYMRNVTSRVSIRNQQSLFVSLTKFHESRVLFTLHSKSAYLRGICYQPGNWSRTVNARSVDSEHARTGLELKNKQATGLSELRSCSLSLSLSQPNLRSPSGVEWRLGAAFVCRLPQEWGTFLAGQAWRIARNLAWLSYACALKMRLKAG